MQNFSFHNPTAIHFGTGAIAQLSQRVPINARVLVLHGGSSAERNGTLAEVREALHGYQFQEFGGIEPNPSYETLIRAVEQVRSEDLDFLLAVGGGSVIDGTKFVAAAVPYTQDPWHILETGGAEVRQALPFGCVLTLPATGSEMNAGSVITRRATQAKRVFHSAHVFPRFSILDPSKMDTLPARQLANGVADAFTHVMEQYLTYPVQAHVQDRLAEALLQTLVDIGPQVLAAEHDAAARASLMWTATLALNGLIGAGVPQDWSTHMIGHELTALHDIDHARTLAVVLPANLKVRRSAKREKLLQYAERVWHLREGTEEVRIDAAIQRTEDFFESLGIPTRLSAYALGAEAVEPIVKQLEAHGLTTLGERRDVTLALSRQILQAAL